MKVKLDSGAYMPVRAHDDDAGFDLFTPISCIVPARKSAIIDLGVHIAIPQSMYGKIESKSGLATKKGILSSWGIIDSGYTGSIKVMLVNITDEDVQFEAGDKVAQIIFNDRPVLWLKEVEELEETERGNNGFGSTGWR